MRWIFLGLACAWGTSAWYFYFIQPDDLSYIYTSIIAWMFFGFWMLAGMERGPRPNKPW